MEHAPAKPYRLSVKMLVRDSEGRFLLLRRSAESRHHAGKWEMPGGKIEPGEDFAEALLREVREETGLEVALERVAGAAESEMADRRIAYVFFEGPVVEGTVRLSSEHDESAWMTRARLAEPDVAPQFARFLRAFAEGSAI